MLALLIILKICLFNTSLHHVCYCLTAMLVFAVLALGLRELCSKSSSLCYSEFPQKLYYYAHYYFQNLLIILIILNFTGEFLKLFSLLQLETSKNIL